MPYVALDPSTAQAAPVVTAGAPLTNVGETLSSFQTELVAALQGRTDSAVSATRQKLWINRAYRHASMLVDLKRLWSSVAITLTADQPFYLLPDQLAWIKQVGVEDPDNYFCDGGRSFSQIDENSYRELPDSNLVDDTELTASYFTFGPMLVIYPTPVTSWTGFLDFRVRVADMVNASDSPLLPTEFHEAIGLLALPRAQRALGMRDQGDRNWNDGVSLIRSTLDTDAQEMAMQDTRMVPIRESYRTYRNRG